jgi:hypothetical protein
VHTENQGQPGYQDEGDECLHTHSTLTFHFGGRKDGCRLQIGSTVRSNTSYITRDARAISSEVGCCQDFLHLFFLPFESFLFSVEYPMRLRGSALWLDGSFPASIFNLCSSYSLSPVSLHHLGVAISSNLEDDFATMSLVESIDEKLLWPYICPREPQIVARFGILMLFSACY